MEHFLDIGKRLKEEREALSKTQSEFAEIAAAAGVAGTTRQSQARYEKGQQSPSVAYLSALAPVGVDIAYVLTGVRSRPEIKPVEVRATVLPTNEPMLAYDVPATSIGARIKEERVRIGLPQPGMAEIADVSKWTVFNWEKDESYPDCAQLAKLGQAGFDVMYLVTGARLQKPVPASAEKISRQEQTLLDDFRGLDSRDKKTVMQLLSSLTKVGN